MQRYFYPQQNLKKGKIVNSNAEWLQNYQWGQKASPGKYKEALESEEVQEIIIVGMGYTFEFVNFCCIKIARK